MSTYQKVIICGNLGEDPNTKHFDNGGQLTNISVATTENWKVKATQEKKSLTEWHRVVMNGKLSEIAEKYLHKGDKVLIEGSLRTRKWTGMDNVEKYTTEIIARSMTMISTKRTDGQGNEQQGENKPSQPSSSQAPPDGDQDDLPF